MSNVGAKLKKTASARLQHSPITHTYRSPAPGKKRRHTQTPPLLGAVRSGLQPVSRKLRSPQCVHSVVSRNLLPEAVGAHGCPHSRGGCCPSVGELTPLGQGVQSIVVCVCVCVHTYACNQLLFIRAHTHTHTHTLDP